MKKALLLSAFMALPFLGFAQAVEQENTELQVVEQEIEEQLVEEQPAVEEEMCYMYNIVTFEGSLNNEGFSVDLDNGKKIKALKNKNGKKMKFTTPAAALMYLVSEGWELVANGATNNSNIITTTYWIMRKPCTKAEFDKAVEEGIKK